MEALIHGVFHEFTHILKVKKILCTLQKEVLKIGAGENLLNRAKFVSNGQHFFLYIKFLLFDNGNLR